MRICMQHSKLPLSFGSERGCAASDGAVVVEMYAFGVQCPIIIFS